MSGCLIFLADATCNNPGELRNAKRTGDQAPYTLNSRVTYTCNICYSGQGTITCRSNGQWSRKPTCTGKYNSWTGERDSWTGKYNSWTGGRDSWTGERDSWTGERDSWTDKVILYTLLHYWSNDTLFKIELFPSIVLSTRVTN